MSYFQIEEQSTLMATKLVKASEEACVITINNVCLKWTFFVDRILQCLEVVNVLVLFKKRRNSLCYTLDCLGCYIYFALHRMLYFGFLGCYTSDYIEFYTLDYLGCYASDYLGCYASDYIGCYTMDYLRCYTSDYLGYNTSDYNLVRFDKLNYQLLKIIQTYNL